MKTQSARLDVTAFKNLQIGYLSVTNGQAWTRAGAQLAFQHCEGTQISVVKKSVSLKK